MSRKSSVEVIPIPAFKESANKKQTNNTIAYLSVPADSKPFALDWVGNVEAVYKEALDELKKALEKVDIKNIKVKTRADASVWGNHED